MNEKSANKPYQALGEFLKKVREHHNETVAEVSGAVEIDNDVLEQIEKGERRPTEDILSLLISHFNSKDDEAARLWELAGYDQVRKHSHSILDDVNDIKPLVMLVTGDNRTVYTDMVQVSVNDFGVVMTFMQTNGSGGQPMSVSRIGMSKEHARSVLDLLYQSLHQPPQPPKSLSAGSDDIPKQT